MIRMSSFLVPVLFCLFANLAIGLHAAPPNFVFIYIDDMGYGDIGPFGATKQKTPALDRMAREGTRFTDFYAAHVCSISRAQLMTGCYGARISVPGVFFPAAAQGLSPAEFTIAERLKPLGYATAIVGKWHLGDQPEFLPTRQGFDSYLGIPYSNDMPRKAQTNGLDVVPLIRDETVEALLSGEDQRGLVARYTDEAVAFIRANRATPFFLYLPHNAVHTPIWPGKAFAGKSGNGRFGDWVEELDWSTGRILDTLRELGLDSNTLVIFSSDNGPWLVKDADGGSAGPLRGGKGSTWEGGVRVPTLAWWPGTVPAGADCRAVAGTIDILPTFVALAGGTLPADPPIDGRDISALLKGTSKESAREAHYYFAGYELQAVRQGPWKLAFAPQPERRNNKNDIPTDAATRAPRLYNLDSDIGERRDVAAEHPEIVARLRALAEKKDAEIGGKDAPARRPPGVLANPKLTYTPFAPPAVSLDDLKPGATVAGNAAPHVGNKPFTLSLDVATSQTDTILIAHGGIAYGYALYLKGGGLVFAVRTGRDVATEITAPAPFPSPARIEANLARDGAMVLTVNGARAAFGKAPGLIAQQPAEDFCVGHDNARSVTDYGTPAAFVGTLSNLQAK